MERTRLMDVLIMPAINLILTTCFIIKITNIHSLLIFNNLSKSLIRIYPFKKFMQTPYKRSPSHLRRSNFLIFIKKQKRNCLYYKDSVFSIPKHTKM